VVGYVTPSLTVSTAVVSVRMIVHDDFGMPLGQLGATTGVDVCPSSTVDAEAEVGTSVASVSVPTVAKRERFIFSFNTTSRPE
jgi:hypothetical protein